MGVSRWVGWEALFALWSAFGWWWTIISEMDGMCGIGVCRSECVFDGLLWGWFMLFLGDSDDGLKWADSWTGKDQKAPCNWSLISSILHITYSIFDFATANPFSNLIFCKVVCCVMSLSLVGFRLFGRDGATPWLPATVTVAFMTYTQLWLQMNDSHLVVHFMDLSFGNCRVSWPETESHVFSTTQKALDLDSFCVSLPLCGNRHVMCFPSFIALEVTVHAFYCRVLYARVLLHALYLCKS